MFNMDAVNSLPQKVLFLKVVSDIIDKALDELKVTNGDLTESEKLRAAQLYTDMLKRAGFEDDEIDANWIFLK
jgi:hypothetical protein